MTPPGFLADMARERRVGLLRQADERRLADAVRATQEQKEPSSDPISGRRRFVDSPTGQGAALLETGAGES
jgi:hypothetical protein